jgi:NAD(P)-dependent dehydrogenase (short-subunit alcohol dehydrogenase family)
MSGSSTMDMATGPIESPNGAVAAPPTSREPARFAPLAAPPRSRKDTMKTRTGELAVVTGASTGIGYATALQLAANGFHVLAGVRRPDDALRLQAAAPNIEPIILDVTSPDHIDALTHRVDTDPDARPLRVLVNNAGIAIDAPIEIVPLAEWKRQFDVAVFGQVAMIQALLPALVRSRGRVVNVGSLLSTVALPSCGPYSGAKAAMDAISDVLRREVAAFGVDVIVIVPGVVTSELAHRGTVTSARIAESMTPEQSVRYSPLLRSHAAQAASFADTGVSADVAAAVIVTAVGARKPRTRYTVGRDAALFTRVAKLLPDRILDRVLLRQLDSTSTKGQSSFSSRSTDRPPL